MIFDSEDQRVLSSQTMLLTDSTAIGKIARLVESRVDVLVCGAISSEARGAAIGAGIRVYAFISGEVPEVLQALLNGRLHAADFAMPGCGHRVGCHGSKPERREEDVSRFGDFPRIKPEERKV
jgi:predicted Fe-Mo cluster-binding NifX family protein